MQKTGLFGKKRIFFQKKGNVDLEQNEMIVGTKPK